MLCVIRPHFLQAAKPGETGYQLEQQIVDGHWVLAFQNKESAESAQVRVAKATEFMKSLVRECLSSML